MKSKSYLVAGIAVIFAFLTSEILLRLCGFGTWQPLASDEVRFEPSSPFGFDSILGYKLQQGTFRINLNDTLSYIVHKTNTAEE